MKARMIIVVPAIALLWIAGYLLAYAGEESKSTTVVADSAKSQAGDSTAVQPHQVVAYYFHGNVRCATCRRIEEYTQEAIDSAFGDQVKSGLLAWRVVNTDSAQNEHYLEEYELYTKSVIVSDLHAGKETRWKNLEQIWLLNGDKAEFVKYIQTEVTAYLDSTK